jgi:hypothetical protein
MGPLTCFLQAVAITTGAARRPSCAESLGLQAPPSLESAATRAKALYEGHALPNNERKARAD